MKHSDTLTRLMHGERRDGASCAFCGKSRREIEALIAPISRPAVAICDECVGLAVDLIAQRRIQRGQKP